MAGVKFFSNLSWYTFPHSDDAIVTFAFIKESYSVQPSVFFRFFIIATDGVCRCLHNILDDPINRNSTFLRCICMVEVNRYFDGRLILKQYKVSSNVFVSMDMGDWALMLSLHTRIQVVVNSGKAQFKVEILQWIQFCCCWLLIPAIWFFHHRSLRTRFKQKFLSTDNFSRNTIPNLLHILTVSSTSLNLLSNGASNSFMLHQKYFLNQQRLKTRF